MKFEFAPKQYWVEYGPKRGWNNEAIGKWAILKLPNNKLYWCYSDGGNLSGFGKRAGIFTEYKGFINT